MRGHHVLGNSVCGELRETNTISSLQLLSNRGWREQLQSIGGIELPGHEFEAKIVHNKVISGSECHLPFPSLWSRLVTAHGADCTSKVERYLLCLLPLLVARRVRRAMFSSRGYEQCLVLLRRRGS